MAVGVAGPVPVHMKLSRGVAFIALLLHLHFLETNPAPVFNVLLQEKKNRKRLNSKKK